MHRYACRQLQNASVFERESFGALHQMMTTLSESERGDTWQEIEQELAKFEGPDGFMGPCEMLVGAGTK